MRQYESYIQIIIIIIIIIIVIIEKKDKIKKGRAIVERERERA